MVRELDTRLEELRNSGVPIYSISRLDTINNCLAEAYMTYVRHLNQRQNIYASLGGKIHDTLEDIVNNKATEEDLLPAIKEELDNMDILGIEFPKDMNGGNSIRDGWIADMKHFCDTYKSPKGDNLHTEELFIYKTPKGKYLQGYIDLYKENSDGTISIYDYKTSSMYSKQGINEHARQLLLYALGKQQEGFKVKSVAWIFLKYVNVEFQGYKTAKSKNKTLIKKTIERKKIGSELSKYVEQVCYEKGIDEIETECILQELKITNEIPNVLKKDFSIKPCVYEYEITEEALNECIKYIDDTIEMWEKLDKEKEEIFTPRALTKLNKSGNVVDDIFFCTNLCGHFEHCKYIQEHLDRK